jgi:hypothetical protein
LAEGVPHAPPGRAHAPLSPLGAAGFPDLRHDMPRLALPLGLRLHVALAFRDDLAGDIWMYLHVTHLLSVPLMDGSPGRGPRPGSWNENPLRCRMSGGAGPR